MSTTEIQARPAVADALPTDVAGWIDLDHQYRIPGRYEISQVLVRGKGVKVWDADGKEYLDFESGQVCASTGHCHPAYTQAIIDQAQTLVQTGSGYTSPARVKLAMKLAEIMPGNLERSYFACTGSEATEVSLRLAKLVTGRSEIVSLIRGYHGMTHASLSATGIGGKFKDIPGSGLPGHVFIPAPYEYRGESGDTSDLDIWRRSLEIINWTSTGAPAAIILEVVMSVGGMIIPSKEYVQAVRKWCDETGALMIIDEAQSGVGRTGKWFAIEHFDVIPDIITTSKSLGGGIPLSAVTTTSEIAKQAAERGFHQSSSHTDDPFLAAVGLAHVEILESEGLVENAATEGAYLISRLNELKDTYEIIGDVRGLGLMIGVEVVVDKASKIPSGSNASAISQYCRDNGLLLGHRPSASGTPGQATGLGGNVIRVLPPLIISREDSDRALDIFEKAIQYAQSAVR